MTTFSEPYRYEVCGSCLVALANDDYSDMDDSEEAQVKSGLAWLEEQHDRVIPDGEELGFSWHDCESCGALAGNRYLVVCFDVKESPCVDVQS